jgi:hypothetical protein
MQKPFKSADLVQLMKNQLNPQQNEATAAAYPPDSFAAMPRG